jgi:hypothetical protein
VVTVLYVEESVSGGLCERRRCAAVFRRIVGGVVCGAVLPGARLPLRVHTVVALHLVVVFTPHSPFLAAAPTPCRPPDLRHVNTRNHSAVIASSQ